MMLVLSVLGALSLAQTSVDGTPWEGPGDVQGSLRGARTLSYDVGAAGLVSGTEFFLGERRSLEVDGGHTLATHGVMPFGSWSFLLGYERFELGAGDDQLQSTRRTLGLNLKVSQGFALGLVKRRAEVSGEKHDYWDAGLSYAPNSWVLGSLRTRLEDARDSEGLGASQYRAGLALRPLAGRHWLTVGSELGWVKDEVTNKFTRDHVAARLDAELTPGVALGVAWMRQGDVSQVWGGLRLALNGGAGSLGAEAGVETSGADGQESILSSGLLWRARGEQEMGSGGLEVMLSLDGTTLSEAGSWLEGPESISRAPMILHELAASEDVTSVKIVLGRLQVGLSDVEELRAGVAAIRAAGKRVTVQLGGADERTYLVASQADEILLEPLATLRLDGFSVQAFYLADALAKVGIKFEAVAIGQYKTGPDALTRSGASDAAREVSDQLLDDAYAWLERTLASDRDLSKEKVAKILAQGSFTAAQALEAGLIDKLTHQATGDALPPLPPIGRSVDGARRAPKRWTELPVIRVVPVVGTIAMNADRNPLPGDTASAVEIADNLARAEADPQVRAVVLRVDSPGGEVMASEHIWRAVRRLAEVKPVVVSMGKVAASGGYWVAAPAAKIFASEQTITGSIGIFSVKPDLSGLYELMGIGNEVTKRGPRADWDSVARPMTDDDRAQTKALMLHYNSIFIDRVKAGRKLEAAELDLVTTGRVWTGKRARALGLVDAQGGLWDAIVDAAARAELGEGDFEVDIQRDSLQGNFLFSLLAGRARAMGPLDEVYTLMDKLRSYDGLPLALMPIQYEVRP